MTKLTPETVTDILGRCDDMRMVEILDTGATPAEVMEAKRWADGDDRTLGDDQALRASVVTRLWDILTADEPDREDRP